MKCLATVILLLAVLVTSAPATDRPIPAADQLVVDRSTRSKTLNDYTLLTRDSIQNAWKTPLDLSIPGALKGRISINYIIGRNGSLEAVQLVRGSGNAELDRSLMAAIRSAAPFPRFPDDLTARNIVIKAQFVVADLPTAPVSTVELPIEDEKAVPADQIPDPEGKKFTWGTPAGTSDPKVPATGDEIPPRPDFKKYQWGMP